MPDSLTDGLATDTQSSKKPLRPWLWSSNRLHYTVAPPTSPSIPPSSPSRFPKIQTIITQLTLQKVIHSSNQRKEERKSIKANIFSSATTPAVRIGCGFPEERKNKKKWKRGKRSVLVNSSQGGKGGSKGGRGKGTAANQRSNLKRQRSMHIHSCMHAVRADRIDRIWKPECSCLYWIRESA